MSIFLAFPPLLLIIHCLFIFLFKRWLGPIGTFYASLSVNFFLISSLIYTLYLLLYSGSFYFIDFGRLFFCLDLIDSNLVFCVDTLSLLASTLVLILTSLALYFGVEYMYRDAFINRLLYLLNLFATSVVFLFFVYDYFLILFVWECIGLFSFLLVNFYSSRIYTIKAALKTFVFSRISDLFMFLAFILTILVYNTTDLSLIFLETPYFLFYYLSCWLFKIHFLSIFTFSLALSGAIKAAQFFFHVWLPDAMEAPTPASALIHSSTLVVAGVFLIIRFSLVFEFTQFVNFFLIILGGLTLVFGAVTATFQVDIKKLVAYSTISQIGYLVCGCGFCAYEEVLFYLVIHALNKAFLFILVGYIVHYFNGNTDMRLMGGSFLYSFEIAVLLFTVGLNLAGLPYSAGFISKEFLLYQVSKGDFISLFIRGCWLISFFFTPIYMLMLTFLVTFNIKKAPITVYSSVLNLKNYFIKLHSTSKTSYSIKFMNTNITSRLTSYILFLFWVFFNFAGEYFLLILYNFSTLYDTIPSPSFFLLKQPNTFLLISNSVNFLSNLSFFIFFLVSSSIIFLININLTVNWNYFRKNNILMFFLSLLLFLI
uniref:NADH dehydrogenase subunit 5 n=1 Tax=Strombidium cf. sulcatum TaxID=2793073 RepID=A0A7T0M4N6_9SPIT|nr:NADH dehydrogenase subunit 5 [Strombidium cf. sulcatum]QPL15931.1 NADH dehydrogenase subunit 5 [Strombidium cf. sulcatum]